MSSSKGSGNQEPRPQGNLGLETPRQGALRAILLPSVHPLAPHPPSLFLLVQPFLVIVGLTPWMTHPGVGFLVPAISPRPWPLGAPQGLQTLPLTIWAPAEGRSKEEGAGPLSASGMTYAFLPLWFCSSSSPHQGIPFLQVLFILPGPPPPGSPAWWPQAIFPALLNSTCLFIHPSGAHFLVKEAGKCWNGAVDTNMLGA